MDFDKIVWIQTEDEHNKFWAARVEGTTSIIRWGRLGTKGQSQTKSHGSGTAATYFVNGKVAEKRRKGYRPVDKAKFDKLSLEAAIVGSQNKCTEMQWVNLHAASETGFLLATTITDEQLADPDVEPGLYVVLDTKKTYDGLHIFRLIFCRFGVFNDQGRPLKNTGEFGELLEKVGEAIASSFT